MSGRDRQKLEQYFNSVREAEKRLVKAEDWEQHPKPVVEGKEPRDVLDPKYLIERLDLMYDMMHLAIQTDSTRFITLSDPGRNLVPAITGVDTDHHMLSHHAKDPENCTVGNRRDGHCCGSGQVPRKTGGFQ